MFLMVKTKLITVRLKEETHEEFKIAAELKGLTMSGLLHQFIVRTIREEKDTSPQSFTKLTRTPEPRPTNKARKTIKIPFEDKVS